MSTRTTAKDAREATDRATAMPLRKNDTDRPSELLTGRFEWLLPRIALSRRGWCGGTDPVQLLGTGGSRPMGSCCKYLAGEITSAYSRYLKSSHKVQKYYKAIFLGLVDVATINAYIDTRAEFLMLIQAQKLELINYDYAERPHQLDDRFIVSRILSADHAPLENPDFQDINRQLKRRHRQCKSVPTSSTASASVVRQSSFVQAVACPTKQGRDIQNREAGICPGKRKQHHQSLEEGNKESVENSAGDTADDNAYYNAGDDTEGDTAENADDNAENNDEDEAQDDTKV
ncbi:Hypothetical protein PHPALM_3455 [Phytophthora palmivora]|uniref:PiggyBac transposable element-derived protein domain-containing protein n=1 Tax=Phytophthora palmivora TaxID=4796 RepID=A0A2P4YMC6_9STRA|nr:Hypothetical protein PHPALM_3455 [Phytophthora palmivora]